METIRKSHGNHMAAGILWLYTTYCITQLPATKWTPNQSPNDGKLIFGFGRNWSRGGPKVVLCFLKEHCLFCLLKGPDFLVFIEFDIINHIQNVSVYRFELSCAAFKMTEVLGILLMLQGIFDATEV